MMTELCAYLRNWFDVTSDHERLPSWTGEFEIQDGQLVGFSDRLLPGQFYRITDSMLNDGVWTYLSDALQDETFTGTVQAMRGPPELVRLAQEIDAWRTENAAALASPYASESFGGYSYSLRTGSSAAGESTGATWQSQFSARLSPWRKI